MFCTNCGEEMRDTDRFCAACGTAAVPREAKKRVEAEPEPQPAKTATPPPEPTRIPQSTAEAFLVPLQQKRTSSTDLTAQVGPGGRVSEPPKAVASIAPASTEKTQEQQRSLLQAEEIASVRDMVPPEVLPDLYQPARPPSKPRVAATLTCPTCGKLNPDANDFCESCDRKLMSHLSPAVEEPDTSPDWLYEPEATSPAVTAPATTAPAAIAAGTVATASAPQPAPTTPGDTFGYYYDDSAAKGNRTLLFVLLGVLALGIIGVLYLMLRPSAKSAGGANVIVRVSPTQANVATGNAYDFAATVTGSGNTDVDWAVQEGSAGGKVVNRGAQARGGEVSSMAVYVAPASPGTYHLIATSKANPAKSASAEITVTPR